MTDQTSKNNKLFAKAIDAGDVLAITQLLADVRQDVNGGRASTLLEIDTVGRVRQEHTSLCVAVAANNFELTRQLLDMGADLQKHLPIVLARSADVVDMLMQPRYLQASQNSVAYKACLGSCVLSNMLRILHQYRGTNNGSNENTHSDFAEAIATLLDNIEDASEPCEHLLQDQLQDDFRDGYEEKAWSPLQRLCECPFDRTPLPYSFHRDVLGKLLELGADPAPETSASNTLSPLFIYLEACWNCACAAYGDLDLQFVALLLDYGADPNYQPPDIEHGTSALHLLCALHDPSRFSIRVPFPDVVRFTALSPLAPLHSAFFQLSCGASAVVYED